MKKGDILRLEDKLYLLCSTFGAGKSKTFHCIKYNEGEKRFITKIVPDVKFEKKELKNAEVVEHYSPMAKKSGKVSKKAGNEPLDFWNSYKETKPTIKEFVCKLVEKYGHPYLESSSYLKSIARMYRGILNDERTQDETDLYPYYIVDDLSPADAFNRLIDEVRKYVKPCIDLYGHKTLDYDYDQIHYAWVVEKYYGNIRGEPVKNYKYYHERFPENEKFADTKLIKENGEEAENEERINRKSNSRKR